MNRLTELQNLIDEGSLLIPLPLTYKGCKTWLWRCARVIPKLYPVHAWRFAIFPGVWDVTNMLLFLRYLKDKETLVREKLKAVHRLRTSSS